MLMIQLERIKQMKGTWKIGKTLALAIDNEEV